MRGFIAIATAIGTLASIDAMLPPGPPAHCADGWGSSSIGKQGACSHHGGVVYPGDWRILPAVGISILAGLGMYSVVAKKAVPPASSDYPPKMTETHGAPRCPGCGGMMVTRIAQAGRNSGKAFWGCRNWPTCAGTKSTSEAHSREHVARPVGTSIEAKALSSFPGVGQMAFGNGPRTRQ